MRLVAVLAVIAVLLGVGSWRALARRGRPRLGAIVLVLLVGPVSVVATRLAVPWLPGPARPTTRVVAAGIRYERHARATPRPRVAHVVRVDLATPGLRLGATRPDDPASALPFHARTTTAFAEETGAVVAMNGDFFEPWRPGLLFGYPRPGDPVRTLGPTWIDGRVLARRSFPGGGAHVVLGPGPHVAFGDRAPTTAPEGADVVGGLCLLLKGGVAVDLAPCRAKKPWQVHPRSAIAVDRDAGELLLVVVDGRQPRYSVGAELDELAALLLALGAEDALSLDGGGSSALVLRDPGGVARAVGSPIADRIPGRERPVANHVGVFVDR